MNTQIDMTEAARAWAKCCVYMKCGKPEMAADWFRNLAEQLGFTVNRPTGQGERKR